MKDYTYTRQSHDFQKIRYKLMHVANRLVELNIAMRNIGEETKDLADFVQAYAQGRSQYTIRNQKAAQANVTVKPTRAALALKAYHASKKAANGAAQPAPVKEEPNENSSLDKLKKEIVRWLKSAPLDPCETIAPLIPAPLSLVKRIRTQLVEAGHLRPLEEEPKQPPAQQ
jgi:hypothetical protein